MSRARLIRSSPALGSSSYGAVGISEQRSDCDDTGLAFHRGKCKGPVNNGSRRLDLDSCVGGSSSLGPRQSKTRRSHSAGRRRSSGIYSDGHRRRPSSATSDVGLGADSKFSFATGLAVPDNPVAQETPVSSPYTSSDEEDGLDMDDEGVKFSEENPPDNSPYVARQPRDLYSSISDKALLIEGVLKLCSSTSNRPGDGRYFPINQ